MPNTHPHIDMPTNDDLRRLSNDRPESIAQLYLEAHALIVETEPNVQYSVDQVDLGIGYGARQFGYDGWGMMAVTPFTKWVTITFLMGAHLPDPTNILEGSAPHMRHVKLKSLEQFEDARAAIKNLILEAAQYHS